MNLEQYIGKLYNYWFPGMVSSQFFGPRGTDWLWKKYGSKLRRQSGRGVRALALAAGSPTNFRSESNVPGRKCLYVVLSLCLKSK